MNKQGKLITTDTGQTKVIGGIEWLKTKLPDSERPGYTWNPVGGCRHRCRWTMPDGETAICYAEDTANRFTHAYPNGFEAHYWRPHNLTSPLHVKVPSRIFLDSMSDLMGHWVPAEQIQAVLDVAAAAAWHTFLLLTKNAPRLAQFDFPANVQVGVSSPPDFMNGRPLTSQAQTQFLERALDTLTQQPRRLITWMSFEPLSWDVAPVVVRYPNALRWAVIGAASRGQQYYQPDAEHVGRLLAVLDEQQAPVFFKGNLHWVPWREDYPFNNRNREKNNDHL